MKYIFIAVILIFSLFGFSQPTVQIMEPFAVYSDPSGNSKVISTPNIMDGAMSIPYVIAIGENNFEVRTNYIEEKTTLDQVVKELKTQFQFNPSAEIISEEYYESFFLISFSSGTLIINGKNQEAISQLAIKIIDEDFIFGINSQIDRGAFDDHKNIKTIIDNFSFQSMREIDNILGLPLSAEYYNALKERARADGKNTSIDDAHFASNFSYSAYFDAWRKLPNYPFSLSDFGQAFFENDGQNPLSIIKKMHHFPLDFSSIESFLPDVRQAFIDTLQQRLFKNGDIIQDIQLSNASSTTFQVYYASGQELVAKLAMVTMKKTDGKWNIYAVNIPSRLSSEYDLQGTFEFVDISPELTVIHSPLELKYYIQSSAQASDKWIEISQLPANSAEYLLVYPQSSIDSHFLFSSNELYVCTRNPSNETYWANAYNSLKLTNKISVLDPLMEDEKSEYFLPYQPVFLNKKEAATRKDFAEIVKQKISPDARLYSSKPILSDLDSDGNKEFTIAYVSDGQVIGGAAYEFTDKDITKLNDQLFKKEIAKTVSIHNLKVYSQFISE